MSDRAAFYRAIQTAPDDDLPRLVFADWLDEHSEPDAAHFLRLLSAARTCPPDVNQLRPLVNQLRRTMVKLPPEFIENACPIPPAVVVGPWVDPDHEANRGVLKWLRGRKRRLKLRDDSPAELDTQRASVRSRCHLEVVERVWESIGPELPSASACMVDGTPCLTDVWSGVLLVVCYDSGYFARSPILVSPPDNVGGYWRQEYQREPHRFPQSIGPDWTHGQAPALPTMELLHRTLSKFDPANHPG